jgi:beta-galactosidase/beta-glucuronidase
MGYNPIVAGLNRLQRRRRLQSDLALMASVGVNTLVAWNPAVVDGLALDVALEKGIGVALPFDVDFTVDVREPSVRSEFVSAVVAWVERHKAHPALRIWALGNEVLQRSVPPTWCATPPSADQASWSRAWSDLFVEAADAIRQRDPLHPVLYREAEDAYVPWLAEALAARPADRPWLIYGINAYTPRLAEIIEGWPRHSIRASLLVSEFAPIDAPRGRRAEPLREIWGVIRSAPSYVLGGAVYVWSTDGPEAVDRAFGLVDELGRPVDDALEAIGELYRAESALAPHSPAGEMLA